jgi:hypothetical protein
MMRLRISARRDLVCQQAVELVTDYLEEALFRADFIALYRSWQDDDNSP